MPIGLTTRIDYTLNPTCRLSIPAYPLPGLPDPNACTGTMISATAPVVAEWIRRRDAGGVRSAVGWCSTGTPVLSDVWYLPRDYTRERGQAPPPEAAQRGGVIY